MIGVFVSPPHDIKISDLKTIKSIVSRSFDLFSYRVEKVKFEYCDWLISSKDLSAFGNFERKKERLEQIYNIGYEAAKNSYSESDFMKELKN